MKKLILFVACFFLTGFHLSAQAPSISLQPVASGFDNPVDIRHCNDSRLFIVEQDGFIRIIDNGVTLPNDFLNIDAIVGSSGNEEGLLGLAFHPDYKNNGYFYVYYTNNSGNIQISRFNVSAADSNLADPGSELPLLQVPHPNFSNHNGGSLHFGPDGYLYAGTGDGGSGGDPQNRAQNLSDRLGKMLRIDVNQSGGSSFGFFNYGIPAGNPFAGDINGLEKPEIWSYGLRNPWRFSFDRLTGDKWIGDVGQNQWEEIDFEPASSMGGVNYGWRCYEGLHPYNTTGCQPQSSYQDPVYEMSHGSPGNYCSVTGGYIYRGATYGDLAGCYFFSDYCNDMIQVLRADGAGGFDHYNTINWPGAGISAFGEDQYGDLYIADLFSGEIVKIVSTVCMPSANIRQSGMVAAQVGETDTIYICADSALIETAFAPNHAYAWTTPSGAASSNQVMATASGWYSVAVVNNGACVDTDSAYVVLQGAPPHASLATLDSVYCTNHSLAPVSLSGFPAGGVFSGAGVTDSTFDFNNIAGGVYGIAYTYTDSNNCSSTAVQYVTLTLCSGIEQSYSDVFRIRGQNPASEMLQLWITAASPLTARYSLTDISGREVKNGNVSLQKGEQPFTMPLSLESGLYVLTLKSREGAVSYRFIWENR